MLCSEGCHVFGLAEAELVEEAVVFGLLLSCLVTLMIYVGWGSPLHCDRPLISNQKKKSHVEFLNL
uniref:Uncharacterized protein n=1 Tax=Rhizophora mucronata TaxID=61149 RepID=A0A2P2LFG1_RHIMU